MVPCTAPGCSVRLKRPADFGAANTLVAKGSYSLIIILNFLNHVSVLGMSGCVWELRSISRLSRLPILHQLTSLLLSSSLIYDRKRKYALLQNVSMDSEGRRRDQFRGSNSFR